MEEKLAAHKVVVYMKRLPPAYDAAVDHFLLWALHGRRDHALFVMGQLYALDKEQGARRNCAQCRGCYEPKRFPLGVEYFVTALCYDTGARNLFILHMCRP